MLNQNLVNLITKLIHKILYLFRYKKFILINSCDITRYILMSNVSFINAK